MEKREVKEGKLKCSKCNYWLPLDQFYNNSESSVGKKSYCKSCSKSYDSKRKKTTFNSGIIGIYLNTCPYCHNDFTTKTPTKTFCSDKCRKRDHYERKLQTETAKNLVEVCYI